MRTDSSHARFELMVSNSLFVELHNVHGKCTLVSHILAWLVYTYVLHTCDTHERTCGAASVASVCLARRIDEAADGAYDTISLSIMRPSVSDIPESVVPAVC